MATNRRQAPEGQEEVTTENIKVQLVNVAGELNDEAAAPEETVDAKPAAQPIINEQMAKTILQVPFAVAASQWGDYWLLSKGELDLMAPNAAVVFSELFGRYVDDHPEAYMLCFTLLACIGSRAAILISDKKAQQQAEAEIVVPVPVGEQEAQQ